MNLSTFLAHAVKLEWEAKNHYEYLVRAMTALNNHDVVPFFCEMADFANHHFEEAMYRAGFSDIAELPDINYQWVAEVVGAAPDIQTGNTLDLERAVHLSLQAERRSIAFYSDIAAQASDLEVIRMATAFAAEEREHERALLRFIGEQPY